MAGCQVAYTWRALTCVHGNPCSLPPLGAAQCTSAAAHLLSHAYLHWYRTWHNVLHLCPTAGTSPLSFGPAPPPTARATPPPPPTRSSFRLQPMQRKRVSVKIGRLVLPAARGCWELLLHSSCLSAALPGRRRTCKRYPAPYLGRTALHCTALCLPVQADPLLPSSWMMRS